jgi:23S rRNA pseudouridine955/2504/2580 synthase
MNKPPQHPAGPPAEHSAATQELAVAPAAAGARTQAVQREVGADAAGQRLDKFLAEQLPAVPRSRVFRLIRKGEVRVNGKRASPEQRLEATDRVRVPPVQAQSRSAQDLAEGRPARVPASLLEQVRSAIIHEDARILVLDKPAGLAVHGGSGLSFGVIEALRAARPGEPLELAHRLDRDTSGILLIARTGAALRTLHALLRDGQVEKRYLALVLGRWELGAKLVDAPLHTDARAHGERTVRVGAGGKEARTRFRLVQHYGKVASLLEATLETGRTHQIRVHAAHCGHPLAGDERYGDAAANERLREMGLARLFLHAHSVAFEWPGGAPVDYSVPLPAALKAVLDAITATGSRTRAGRKRGG